MKFFIHILNSTLLWERYEYKNCNEIWYVWYERKTVEKLVGQIYENDMIEWVLT